MNIEQLKNNIKLIEDFSKELGIDVNRLTIDKSSSRSGYYNTYHISINLPSKYYNFSIDGSPTGCGLIILHHITNFLYDEDGAKILKKSLDFFFRDELRRAGLVFCTLGSAYYKDNGENLLVNIVGFEETCEYMNPNMQDKGQKVFIKRFNQNENNKEIKRSEIGYSIYEPEEVIISKTRRKTKQEVIEERAKPIDAISIGKRVKRAINRL